MGLLLVVSLARISVAQTFEWALVGGGTGSDFATAIAGSNGGGLYVCGSFRGPTAHFGGTTLMNRSVPADLPDGFVAKYDDSGNSMWATSLGGAGPESIYDLCVASSGELYVTGTFNHSQFIFGDDTLRDTVHADAFFIAKYDSAGNEVWARTDAAIEGSGKCVAADRRGHVCVAGPCSWYGNAVMRSFLRKYGADGTLIWSKTLDSVHVYGMSVNHEGRPCLTGRMAAAWNESVPRLFVSQFDTSGLLIWRRTASAFGLSTSDPDCYGARLATDALGNAFVVGDFRGLGMTVGGTTLSNSTDGYCAFCRWMG